MKINYVIKFEKLLSLLVLISPIFFLTIKHWTNLVVFLLFAGCLYLLVIEKTLYSSIKGWPQKICGLFFVQIVAVVLGQAFRHDFYSANWDAPIRFVLCIPIFLAISNGYFSIYQKTSINRTWLTVILPITLLLTLVFIIIWPTKWGLVDVTTYFVDPLTFGSYTLLFSILIILGLSDNWDKLSWIQRCLCILGIMSGFYLSLKSGSRTGWFNLPFFCFVWSYFVLIPKYGFKKTFLIFVIFLCFILGVFSINDYFLDKFRVIWFEISSYQWSDSNPDTSVRLRLSIYRMGIMYFLERPFAGWGDLSWMVQMNRLEFVQFASEYARESPKHGFHNEIITNAVRSGVWGLIATLGLFGMVFMRAIQGLRVKSTGDHRLVSLTLLVFISHLFIASLTTEITNLVFLSSFIGLTLAVLLGEQIYLEENAKHDLNQTMV